MSTTGLRRILVATDGSESADSALDLAGSLAIANAAYARVVHVWDLEIHHRHRSSDAAVRSEAGRLIAHALDRLRVSGVKAEGQLAHADDLHVAALLAEVAREFEPGLLVVGSRALSNWHSLAEHRVGHELLTGLSCPMALVRSRPDGNVGGPMRVVVAVSRKDDIAPTVGVAAALAVTPRSSVLVMHLASDITAEPHESMQAIADEAVEALALSGISADAWLMRPGPVAGVVAEAAGRWRADVVVLGAGRTGDAGSMLFGSVSHDLLHATERPVLVAEKSQSR